MFQILLLATLLTGATELPASDSESVHIPSSRKQRDGVQQEEKDRSQVGRRVVLKADAKIEFEMELYSVLDFGVAGTVIEENEKFLRLRSASSMGWVSRNSVLSLEEGTRYYRELTSQDLDQPDQHIAVAKALSSLEQEFELAKKHCLRALELDDKSVEALKTLGNCCLFQGEEQSAEKYYKQALEIDPNYTPALNNMGNVLLRAGDYAAAIEVYEKAIAVRPVGLYYRNLGIAYERLGDQEASLASYRQSAKRSPWDPECHYVVAYACLEYFDDDEDRLREAAESLEKASQLSHKDNENSRLADYLQLLVRTWSRLGEDDKAAAAQERLELLDAEDDRPLIMPNRAR